MLHLTKIFYFEMAHALLNYQGPCSQIHGHSYQLHVTVKAVDPKNEIRVPPGFLVDFKELKNIVTDRIIGQLDHRLVLSQAYIAHQPKLADSKSLLVFEQEPTAENLIFFIARTLENAFPKHIALAGLKLFETHQSYAEWFPDV